MTEEFTDRLAAAGFADEDAASRALLVARADAALQQATTRPVEWRWFVPGRLEVFGKHTDYAGGRTLVASVPRGFAVAASSRPDRIVTAIDARTGERATIDLTGDDQPVRGWRAYVAVAARRLASNFPDRPLGADLAFISDLPRAAGVSSSSALVVGVAETLIRRGGLEEHVDWRRTIVSVEARAEYFGTVENGHSYGPLEGTRGVGTQGGSEDHAAILMGQAGVLQQLRFVPIRRLGAVAMPGHWTFVIMSSGVHADKAGSVRDRYNRAAQTARALVGIWERTSGERCHSLAAALATDGHALTRLRSALTAPPPDFTTQELADRLAHFVREDARVPEAAEAFRVGNVDQVRILAAESQDDAATLLGNQVPETIALAETALASGAYAASSFGAGFGGSAWALVSADDAAAVGERWMAAYRRRYPDRVKAQWFAAGPAPGALAL